MHGLFARNPGWQAFGLIACRQPEPHYVLIHDAKVPAAQIDIESALRQLHHYQVAREIGQLQKARSLPVRDVFAYFSLTGRSQVLGQNKVEVLLEVDQL